MIALSGWKNWLQRSGRPPSTPVRERDPEQRELAFEDPQTAMASVHVDGNADASARVRDIYPRAANCGSLPENLPRIEEVVGPKNLVCACADCLHRIGEDTSDRLVVIPAQFRFIVFCRSKYAYRACADGTVQARAPARLIP